MTYRLHATTREVRDRDNRVLWEAQYLGSVTTRGALGTLWLLSVASGLLRNLRFEVEAPVRAPEVKR